MKTPEFADEKEENRLKRDADLPGHGLGERYFFGLLLKISELFAILFIFKRFNSRALKCISSNYSVARKPPIFMAVDLDSTGALSRYFCWPTRPLQAHL